MSALHSSLQKAPFLYLNDHPDQHFELIDQSLVEGNHALKQIGVDSSFIIKDSLFNARNIDIIQKWLVFEVERQTHIIIPYQNEQHVLQAMTGTYAAYAQNLPYSLKEQIHELNLKVVRALAEAIVTELYARTRYLRKIETANYMDRPLFVGAKGQRALPSTHRTI